MLLIGLAGCDSLDLGSQILIGVGGSTVLICGLLLIWTEAVRQGSVRRGPGQKSEAESSRGGEGHVGSRLETNTLGAASI